MSLELLLDAWPVLEWIKGREPCASLFQHTVEEAIAGRYALSMSRINYGEAIYSIRKSIPANTIEAALKAFREIPIRLHSVDDLLIDEAVDLKSVYAISYADAFAAALAIRCNLPLITGDPELRALAGAGLTLHWIGA